MTHRVSGLLMALLWTGLSIGLASAESSLRGDHLAQPESAQSQPSTRPAGDARSAAEGVRWSAAPEPHPVSGLAVGGAVVAGQPITFEIADTPAAMQRGLMFRESMPDHHGMLFVWAGDGPRTMWMRNTPLPLSVAFLDRRGRILNIEDMHPQSIDLHSSRGAARYALEMHQGWFARHGLGAGDSLDFLSR